MPLDRQRESMVMVITGRARKEQQRWWLGEKEVGEIDDYKYLGVCMAAKLKRHVHLEKIL